MILNNVIIDFIDKANSNEIFKIIAFIAVISFVINTLYLLLKKRKHLSNYLQQQSLSRDILISVLSVFCGLLSPIYLLSLSFSNWSGWQLWLTQILSWYVLLSFSILAYIILSMNKAMKELD